MVSCNILTTPLTYECRGCCWSRVGIIGAICTTEHGNAREDSLVPELAIGTLHVMRRPYASVRDAHVEALAVVRVGGKPR